MTIREHITNGIDMDVIQQTVSAVQQDPDLAKMKFHITNKWEGGSHNCSTISSFYGAKQEMPHKHPFQLYADEPPLLSGNDDAANPVEHLLNALASCVTTSMVAHAAVRGIRIDALESQIEGDIDLRGFLGLAPDVPKGFTNIRVKFKVQTDIDDLSRLERLAEFSPVLNTITHGAKVDVRVEK